ncbi:MAG: ATP-binding cassette domain-containing protein [Chloroflexi bacterium]|nr:ATP-binding cassette domain-containing protein [Chloroflexota bacterium]
MNRGAWFIASTVFLVLASLLLLLVGDVLGAGLIIGWLLIAFVVTWWFTRGYIKLNAAHNRTVSLLLERLRGHATRLVQERDWYEQSDRELAAYLRQARKHDGRLALAWVWVPYGALLLIIISLAPDFILNIETITSANLAINLRFAALLFTFTQVQFLALALPDVALMAAMWAQTKPLRQAQPAEPAAVPPADADVDVPDVPLVEATNLTYRYAPETEAVFAGLSAQITPDAQILLSGASGSGKSTFAQVLSGLRSPQSGLVLLRNYDLPTLGARGWRKRVVLVPQFYNNRLFDAPLAFNLLMGRRPPYSDADLQAAETVCRELGLGALIDRMPRGLHQRIGAGGWQLSHGERNRIYIARALLQNADLTIFDESLAGLDPHLLHTVYTTLRARTNALMVISHEVAS